MADRAKVISSEAIESFRASLIVYIEKTRAVLDDISDDVTRTRMWLEDEKRSYWQNEIRHRGRDLERKQAALFEARLSLIPRGTIMEQAAVLKAKQSMDEAVNGLEMVRKWIKQYDSRVKPLAKDVDKLRDVLVQHMGRAVIHLTRVLDSLAAYADKAPAGPMNPAGEEGSQP